MWEASSSPTSTAARPGRAPTLAIRSTSSASSSWICAATALPSNVLAVIRPPRAELPEPINATATWPGGAQYRTQRHDAARAGAAHPGGARRRRRQAGARRDRAGPGRAVLRDQPGAVLGGDRLPLRQARPPLLDPAEQERLLELGLGITNLVERATAGAAELRPAELREGGELLVTKLRRYRPAWVAFLGLGAFGTAFGLRQPKVGPAPALVEGMRAWLLPNPSGLNAHYRPGELAAAFAELREAADSPGG